MKASANSGFIAVPFKGEKGLSELYGIAKFSRAGIVVEFESKLLGMIDGGVKEIRVPLEDILDVRLRRGVFGFFAQIQMRLNRLESISKLPNESGRVKLSIRRVDFKRAEEAVEFINGILSGDSAELPPKAVAVGELFEAPEKEDKYKTNELLDTKRLDEE
ncbi:MAG: hypothetical protein R2684_04760 [Pyrinomonadaceae bacterium]